MNGLVWAVCIILIAFSVLLILVMLCMISIVISFPATRKHLETIYEKVSVDANRRNDLVEAELFINESRYVYRIVKRMFDILISLAGILLFSFTMFTIAIILWFTGSHNIICKKKIIGYKGRDTYYYIFRQPNDENSFAYKFINKTGIDYLPMYFNVFSGKLTCVGLSRMRQTDDKNRMKLYDYEKPGMASLAYIFKAGTSEERYFCDLYYLNHKNFILDLRILFGSMLMPSKGYGEKGATIEKNDIIKQKDIYDNSSCKPDNHCDTGSRCPSCSRIIPNELSNNLIYCPYCGIKFDLFDGRDERIE